MADNTSPATKEDIAMMMEQIGSYYDRTEKRLVKIEDRIEASEERMTNHIAASEDQMKRHFDVVTENLHYDLLGAHKDKIQQHEDRIRRLEKHTKLIAA